MTKVQKLTNFQSETRKILNTYNLYVHRHYAINIINT